jgi:hypothetical protein
MSASTLARLKPSRSTSGPARTATASANAKSRSRNAHASGAAGGVEDEPRYGQRGDVVPTEEMTFTLNSAKSGRRLLALEPG